MNNLVIVGSGIKLGAHITVEAEAHICQADKVLFLATDDIFSEWIFSMNPQSESLNHIYQTGKHRLSIYRNICDKIIDELSNTKNLCVVFYGHPGVFVTPSHDSIRKARQLGHSAKMLPAISAEDCLFADLLIDPGDVGCQSFEATDFLLRELMLNSNSHTVLWQIGCVGDLHANVNTNLSFEKPLTLIVNQLLNYYHPNWEILLYVAANSPAKSPFIKKLPLKTLNTVKPHRLATLYIPPIPTKYKEIGKEIIESLGIKAELLKKI